MRTTVSSATITFIIIVLSSLMLMAYADEQPAPPPEKEAFAEEKPETPSEDESKRSPWLFTPILSSDPKISTAAGALVGYVHQFDEKSPPSMFGVAGTYSTTDSWYLGIFAKTHFGGDKHRLTAVIGTGEVRNDYSDFLGTGLDVQTTDDLTLYALRYAYRIYGRWYLGPQFISTNYAISGDNFLSGKVLEHFGLIGFRSNGIGLYTQYDTRDNQYSPSTGQVFAAHNVAFREGLGGDVSFDAFTADYRYYNPHLRRHVLALHAYGRWTIDAPPSGYSSVNIRSYTRGQYLAPYITAVEADYRYALNNKWGLAAYGGFAVLYGNDTSDEGGNCYPAGGLGAFYQLNDEKMVIRADFAVGKDDNWGFYLQLGHPF